MTDVGHQATPPGSLEKWKEAFLRRLSLLQREVNTRSSVGIEHPPPEGMCQCGQPEFSCSWCEE